MDFAKLQAEFHLNGAGKESKAKGKERARPEDDERGKKRRAEQLAPEPIKKKKVPRQLQPFKPPTSHLHSQQQGGSSKPTVHRSPEARKPIESAFAFGAANFGHDSPSPSPSKQKIGGREGRKITELARPLKSPTRETAEDLLAQVEDPSPSRRRGKGSYKPGSLAALATGHLNTAQTAHLRWVSDLSAIISRLSDRPGGAPIEEAWIRALNPSVCFQVLSVLEDEPDVEREKWEEMRARETVCRIIMPSQDEDDDGQPPRNHAAALEGKVIFSQIALASLTHSALSPPRPKAKAEGSSPAGKAEQQHKGGCRVTIPAGPHELRKIVRGAVVWAWDGHEIALDAEAGGREEEVRRALICSRFALVSAA